MRVRQVRIPGRAGKKLAVEGHYIDIWHGLKDGALKASGLQIVRNYQNAIKKIGGQVVYEGNDGGWITTTLKIAKDGKGTLKPESESTIAEIAKLIKSNPGLKLYVVGHIDNTGGFDANMKLSMDRAASVVSALVTKHSISEAILKACGNGPTSPVASNDTEEGKALKRRVELVKQ